MRYEREYTTVEQGKKLTELGLSSDSADMCYDYSRFQETEDSAAWEGYDTIPRWRYSYKDNYNDTIPCWSVYSLLKELPKIENLALMINVTDNRVFYEGHKTIPVQHEVLLIDAIYNMMVWLFENGYMK